MGFLCNCLSYFTTAKISFTSTKYVVNRHPEKTMADEKSQKKVCVGG